MTKSKLGMAAYVIDHNGVISRTIVHVLIRDGKYGLLNGRCSDDQHFFDFANAVSEAKAVLYRRKSALEKESDCIDTLIAQADNNDYKTQVDAVQLTHGPNAGFLANALASVATVPESHFEPGQQVYAVITPKTFYCYIEGHGGPPYFILKCLINAVNLHGGRLSYQLNTLAFTVSPQLIFSGADEAAKQLAEEFTKETFGTLEIKNIKIFAPDEVGKNGQLLEV